ncbi:MAG: DUF6555 family protein [Pseudomonas sp.]|uniref:DUF6555 family protein n=1 Tax=Pseudomonas sp. TaxID=306 RepID=UPI003D6EC9C9
MREESDGPFKWQSLIELNQYEIHYVLHGLKKVVLKSAKGMTERDAWFIAAIDGGAPLSEIPSEQSRTALITAAEAQGVSMVRWNLCPRAPRQRSFS